MIRVLSAIAAVSAAFSLAACVSTQTHDEIDAGNGMATPSIQVAGDPSVPAAADVFFGKTSLEASEQPPTF